MNLTVNFNQNPPADAQPFHFNNEDDFMAMREMDEDIIEYQQNRLERLSECLYL